MEKFTNKDGYLLTAIMATLYSVAMHRNFIGNFLAVILMSSIIGGILMFLSKSKNFGKFLGITTLILSIISFLGNRNIEKLKKEVNAQKVKSINQTLKVLTYNSIINQKQTSEKTF
jgi:hypothetical protein